MCVSTWLLIINQNVKHCHHLMSALHAGMGQKVSRELAMHEPAPDFCLIWQFLQLDVVLNTNHQVDWTEHFLHDTCDQFWHGFYGWCPSKCQPLYGVLFAWHRCWQDHQVTCKTRIFCEEGIIEVHLESDLYLFQQSYTGSPLSFIILEMIRGKRTSPKIALWWNWTIVVQKKLQMSAIYFISSL